METTNKVALVTGGSRGLGRDMALNLAANGNHVVITYHSNKDKADEVVEAIKATGQKGLALQLDTSNVSEFDSFISSLKDGLAEISTNGKFDFLINNAGIGHYMPFAQTTEEDFDQLMNIHLKGVYFLTQKSLDLLNDGGRIINISSGLARFSMPGSSAYAAMKGGVEVLTRYLAKELGSRQIAANTVAPGAIETDFGGGRTRDDEAANKMVANFTALGRAGLPEDIGGVVAFLCSEAGRWVNGQRIEVSGGMML